MYVRHAAAAIKSGLCKQDNADYVWRERAAPMMWDISSPVTISDLPNRENFKRELLPRAMRSEGLPCSDLFHARRIFEALLYHSSALNQTDGTGQRSSLARMASADWVHTKGLGQALCSAR